MPSLTVIAGCNGAGKSIFAPTFLPENIHSFDYDKLYLSNYNSLPDSEFRVKFARDRTTKEFERLIYQSLENQTDFCYETNFDTYPIYWAEKFRERGFILNIIFFCLDNQDIARHRIQVRTEFKGHFVDNYTIDLKWKAGYKNINEHYSFFDNILFVDNSKDNELYTNILQIEDGVVELMSDKVPEYFARRLPRIFDLLNNE